MIFNLRKSRQGIIKLAGFLIILMFIVDYFLKVNYMQKSLIKILLLLLIPIFYSRKNRNINYSGFFRLSSLKELLFPLFLGLMTYGLIVGAYFLLKDLIDLKNIEKLLGKNLKVNRDNFILVGLYIAFFNSFLEEVFFRGFLFLSLKRLGSSLNAYLISSLFFTVYHLAIIVHWFNLKIFILAMASLFIGGLFFNGLNHRRENIYNSWLVHMFANLAINTVGLIMFGKI